MTKPAPSPRPQAASSRALRARLLFLAACALLATVHFALTDHFVPLHAVLGPAPIQGDDFDLHIGQTYRVLQGLDGWGKSWVYDVQLLAGQPEGTIFDADNKGCELWTYALWKLGASKAVAFNSFTLLGTLLVPLVVFAAARLFFLGPWPSLFAAALGSALWFFDSFAHWVWFVGMVSYGFASYLALLSLALFYRYLEQRRAWTAVACALLLGVGHLIHPYTFFVLAPPMAALYLRSFRDLHARGQLTVGAIVLTTVACNAYWLRVALAHWHYVLDSAYYGQANAGYLVADFFDVLRDPTNTGVIGTRTGFRLLAVALGAAGLLAWRSRGDRRVLPLGTALLWLLGLSYFAGYLPGGGQIQPYRHVLPASFFATLPAAGLVEWLVRERALSGLHRGAQALLAILALLVMQHLGIEALYFLPGLLPETHSLVDGTRAPISKYGFIDALQGHSHVSYSLPHPQWLEADGEQVVSWVANNVPKGSRVLVDSGVLGERIAWKTGVEVMGGFRERNIAHAYANFFRRYGDRQVAPAQLARYLRTFGIGWVILQNPRADIAAAPAVLEPLPAVAGRLILSHAGGGRPGAAGRWARARAHQPDRAERQRSDAGRRAVVPLSRGAALRAGLPRRAAEGGPGRRGPDPHPGAAPGGAGDRECVSVRRGIGYGCDRGQDQDCGRAEAQRVRERRPEAWQVRQKLSGAEPLG